MRLLSPSRRGLAAPIAALALAASSASAHTDYPSWTQFGVPSGYSSTCSDGSGGIIVVWAEARGGFTLDVYAQRLDALGNTLWTPGGERVSASADEQWTPAVAPDDAGGAIVTWTDPNSSGDIMAQRISAAGALLWSSDGVAACATPFHKDSPTIAADGSGGVIIAWVDDRNESQGDLYAQRLDASGVAQWAAGGVPVCTAAGAQLWPSAIPDGQGGCVITWDDDRFAGKSSPFAQRLGPGGGALWTADGVLLGNSPNGGGGTVPVSDGQHGAIVTWETRVIGPLAPDSVFVYVQRVDSSGTLHFGAAAERTDSLPGRHQSPTICSDGADGAIVAWQDPRGPVYAQRVTGDGAGLWSSLARPVSSASGMFPMLAPDGAGGAFAGWWQNDAGTKHAYAQHLDGAGDAQWGTNGVHVAPPNSTQMLSALMDDGAGGTFVTWKHRGGQLADSSMFVTRLSSAGFSLYPEDGVRLSPPPPATVPPPNSGIALALDRPRPDPASGPFRVEFMLPTGGSGTLALSDAAGRRVESHVLAGLDAGPHAMVLGGGGRLAPGVYVVSLTQAGATLTRKVSVVR